MDVRGTVTDEHGQALDGVTLTVQKVTLVGIDWHPKGGSPEVKTSGDEKTRVISGRFHESGGFCNWLTLEFSKEGYYPSTIDCGFGADATEVSGRGVRYSGNSPLIVRDVHVVLEKKGKITELNKLDTEIPLGDTQAIAFNVHDVAPGQEPEQVQAWAENAIAIEVEKNVDGSLAERIIPDDYYGPTRIARCVRLIMRDGGFLVFRPDPQKDLPRQMKLAPESSYQRELVIDQPPEPGGVYFYFCHKGLYGRGCVSIDNLRQGVEPKVRVNLSVQPDGSRNLETEDRGF